MDQVAPSQTLRTVVGHWLDRVPALERVARGVVDTATHARARSKWKAALDGSPLCLELGAGARPGRAGWLSVDRQLGADLTWDLRRPVPLSEGSVDRIYSSHMLEHIPYPEMLKLVGECRRILRPGGEFLVCVPDARFYIGAYLSNRWAEPREDWWQPAAVDTNSFIDQVNYIAYMNGGHQHMFDKQSLVNTLRRGGSAQPRLGRSTCPIIESTLPTHAPRGRLGDVGHRALESRPACGPITDLLSWIMGEHDAVSVRSFEEKDREAVVSLWGVVFAGEPRRGMRLSR